MKSFFGYTTGSSLYVIIIDVDTAYMWDDVNGELSDAPSYADLAVDVSEISSSCIYEFVSPTGLPKGKRYKGFVHKKAGGSPANTDPIVGTIDEWSEGSNFGF